MTETIHYLVAKYGLIAVFLGCVAEGESAAILAGFFAHQKVFVPWQALAAAFFGAFLGDTLLFFLGRRYSSHSLVLRLRKKPGSATLNRLVLAYPNLFVFFNRYAYGMRMIGGVTAGLSGMAIPRFLALMPCHRWSGPPCSAHWAISLASVRRGCWAERWPSINASSWRF